MKLLAWYSAILISLAVMAGFVAGLAGRISDNQLFLLVAFLPAVIFLWLQVSKM